MRVSSIDERREKERLEFFARGNVYLNASQAVAARFVEFDENSLERGSAAMELWRQPLRNSSRIEFTETGRANPFHTWPIDIS